MGKAANSNSRNWLFKYALARMMAECELQTNQKNLWMITSEVDYEAVDPF